jgi:hypothetical protein
MSDSTQAEQPYPDLDALLRTYLAGLRSGYMSVLTSRFGATEAAAYHYVGHIIEAVMSDPLARNCAVDVARAAYLDDPSLMPPGHKVSIDITGCAE